MQAGRPYGAARAFDVPGAESFAKNAKVLLKRGYD
jgi:hypothetical protein